MTMTVKQALSIANGITHVMNSRTGVNTAVVTLAGEVERLQPIIRLAEMLIQPDSGYSGPKLVGHERARTALLSAVRGMNYSDPRVEHAKELQAIVDTLPLNGDGDRITLGSKQWLRLRDCWVQAVVLGISKPEIRVGHGGDDYRDYAEYVGPKTLFTNKPNDKET